MVAERWLSNLEGFTALVSKTNGIWQTTTTIATKDASSVQKILGPTRGGPPVPGSVQKTLCPPAEEDHL